MHAIFVSLATCVAVTQGVWGRLPMNGQGQAYTMPTAVEQRVYNQVGQMKSNHGYPMSNQGHSGYNMMNTQTTYMGNGGNNGYQGNRKTSPFSAMLPYVFAGDFGSDLMSGGGEMGAMLPMMAAMKGGNLGMSNPFLTSMMMANMY